MPACMPISVRLLLLLPTLFILLAACPSSAQQDDTESMAEGKYSYLTPDGANRMLPSRWAEFSKALPDWRQKGKKAHYKFKKGVDGRKCDSKECHPGFVDQYVQQLIVLADGKQRIKARQERFGLTRCDDCHKSNRIKEKTVACRLHFDLRDRVQCTSCHSDGNRQLQPVGINKTITLINHDSHRNWPVHQLTKDEKKIDCNKACHEKNNPFGVTSSCQSCHAKGQLELASYLTNNLLVHAKAQDSVIPDMIKLFYKIFIAVFALFCGLFILLDIIRNRKEA